MNIAGISLNLSREEIVAAVRESRKPDRAAFEAASTQALDMESEVYDRLEKPAFAPMLK